MQKTRIFPTENEKLITVAISAILIGLLLGVTVASPDGFTKIFLPAFSTLLAAFLGAWYAFKLNRDKEHTEIQTRNITAGNFAIFTFNQIYNHLYGYQRQIIEPHKNNPYRSVLMMATLGSKYDDISFDYQSLSFLIGPDHVNLLGEISAFESRYSRTINAIKERSRILVGEVQPLLEKNGIRIGEEYTFKQFQDAIGDRLLATLDNSTNHIIDAVDKDLTDAKRLCSELHHAMKSIYPREKLLKMGEAPEVNK